MSVEIKVDSREVMRALDRIDPKAGKQILQKATNVGAKYLKPKVVSETPTGPGHFGYHLKRRVVRGPAKRDKPAAIVKYRSAREHFTLAGTKGHSTKRVRSNKKPYQRMPDGGYSSGHQVSGAKANPIIRRVADQHGDRAMDLVMAELRRLLKL